MEIDSQAPFAGRKEIFIKASPKVIWKLQSDINGWSAWQTHIAKSSMEGPLAAGTVFHWKARGLNITSTLQVVQANKCIGWTGKAFGTQARHIFTFKPLKNGTLVIAEESLNGWLAKLMKIILPNYLEESMEASLKTLKVRVETGLKRK